MDSVVPIDGIIFLPDLEIPWRKNKNKGIDSFRVSDVAELCLEFHFLLFQANRLGACWNYHFVVEYYPHDFGLLQNKQDRGTDSDSLFALGKLCLSFKCNYLDAE